MTFEEFLQAFENRVIPLSKKHNMAYFDATISGRKENFQRAADLEIELIKIYANKEDFQRLKTWSESGSITQPLQQRQLEVLYHAFLARQVDEAKLEATIKLQNQLEQAFTTFRAAVNGTIYTDNEIEETLKSTTDSELARNVWLASKEIGPLVEPEVLKLVGMRNETAADLGFPNYHAMQLALSEQDPAGIEKLFDDLDELTRNAFAHYKDDLDAFLSARFGIEKTNLMPWHYQNRFFQEAPKIYQVDLDQHYRDQDVVQLTKDYFAGIGLEIDDIIDKSDLFEQDGKYQHAYCMDIDRQGDIRVLCNVKPNYNWMNTMLHEFGHAVYDKFQAPQMPWLLRTPTHIFTTEAIAMLFGRLASNAAWMDAMFGIEDTEKSQIASDGFELLRAEQLVFSRWVQVMYRFEKAMFENPAQDLNSLWWDLVEEYQMICRPPKRDQPDWATKIHMALYPAYYHNYMMGELLASQLHYFICEHVLTTKANGSISFAGSQEIGRYLIENIFEPGNSQHWSKIIANATGEELTPKFFARQFVNSN